MQLPRPPSVLHDSGAVTVSLVQCCGYEQRRCRQHCLARTIDKLRCRLRRARFFFSDPFVPMASAGIEPHECVCIVCLDSDPPPIQSGCACRSDTGLAHVGCLVEKAVSQQPHRGNAVWWECQTCGQKFTGAMRMGLAVCAKRSHLAL